MSTEDKISPVGAGAPDANNASDIIKPGANVGDIVQSRGTKLNRKLFWLVGASVLVCAWAYSLDSSTTSYYSVDASSYFKQYNSVLATMSIATSIISAVSKPFIAKISDITSRPYTYLLILGFYIVGYIIAATSKTISAYVVGEVFVAIGGSGINLTNDIIVADLTPLEWRGFASSMLSTPFIINTWFLGKTVNALEERDQWRWGYGMFAIIMPVALGPAVAALIWLDRMAKKKGAKQWTHSLKMNLEEIDAFGLVLLGFGWSLLLLPFSLKTYAEHGWRNQSLIAMMIVGGLLLIAYVVTHWITLLTIYPYLVAGNIRSLYWSSYVYVAKPWSYQDWVYYGNTLTLALCITSLFIVGLCIKLIGMGIMLDGRLAAISTGALVMSSILVCISGSMSVVGSRVASQVSVPHQDVALAVSLLSLWSKIGSAIGSAIVAVIWSNQMPKQLRKCLPGGTSEATVKKLFGDMRSLRTAYDFDDPIRQGAITAYRHALYYCITVALGLAFIPLVAAFFQTNYFLGKQQNAVTDVGNDGLPLSEKDRNPDPLPPPRNRKEAFLRFWAGSA
ncbi:major facilitator superfamily domain-containing protein [Trichoderma evansii]